MDNQENVEQLPAKRRQYKKILDKPLSTVKRRIAVSALDSATMAEATRRAGTTVQNSHIDSSENEVMAMSASKLLSKQATIAKIEAFCLDIMSREAETPLKHSDKVAVARLLADIKGANDTKHTVDVNVGILDLRQASDEELAQELDRIENQKRSVIDVQQEQSPSDSSL